MCGIFGYVGETADMEFLHFTEDRSLFRCGVNTLVCRSETRLAARRTRDEGPLVLVAALLLCGADHRSLWSAKPTQATKNDRLRHQVGGQEGAIGIARWRPVTTSATASRTRVGLRFSTVLFTCVCSSFADSGSGGAFLRVPGRGGGIRTHGPSLPKRVRYQAAPHPGR